MKESQLNPQVADLAPAGPTLTAYEEELAAAYVCHLMMLMQRCLGNASGTARRATVRPADL
jgi:hypothetical protein